ncbi:MAG: NfeD family protein [Rhodospirillales bacterium]|nr:NfeD family protein [Rhodospirillales bacterium]
MEYLEQLSFWHWLIAGIAFSLLELLLPGVVFLWIGIAAVITGFILLAIPGMSWEFQFMAFAVLSVLSVAASRYWIRKQPTETDQPTLNQRGRQMVGRALTLDQPITNGEGRVKAGDTTWKVRGPDLPAGTRVRVSDTDGATLIVRKDTADAS